MSSIKERPILFSAPMVRAILEGRKTVTRRALNQRAIRDIGYGAKLGECYDLPESGSIDANSLSYIVDFCPYGKPGGRLWVRETFAPSANCRPPISEPYIYGADLNEDGVRKWAATWKPSIHMPRAASRILLEITAVRVVRLQDISAAQIEAEGIDLDALADGQDRYDMCHAGSGAGGRPTLLSAWRDLWQSINGSESWDENPWVWVVEFKRVTP